MSTPLAAEASPITASPRDTPGGARSSWSELWALVRLACFLRVNSADITGRDSTIALLAGVALAVWIAVDPLLHSRDLVFTWYAVPDLICIAAGVFTLPWLIERFTSPALEYRRALVLTLGALPLAMLCEVASWKLVSPALQVLTAATCLYGLLFFARGLRLLTGRPQYRALLAGAITTAIFLASLEYLQANPRLWIRADEKLDPLNAAGVDWARMARVQFTQQSRIDADIARLAPQVPSVPEVFFVGFAGYGQEQIFAREIDLAAEVVGRRFSTSERSVRLVNDRLDLETWPIASEPGLRHALRKLGEAMGEEDVLFLTLSSHGARDTGLRVSNPGTVPAKLSAGSLDEMLREAGITWRVIVVSACYSGSFVDELSNDHSIVITAAAEDRKSFGCNDRRQITYFGEAFFRDALNGTGSLRVAFETARTALGKKERAGGIVPSLPQASFGRLIEAKLEKHGAR